MRPRNRSSPDRRRPSPSRRSRLSSSTHGHSPPMMHPQQHYRGGHPGHPGYHGPPPPGHHPAAQDEEAPTPICRCRVLYLGSAVPHVTKDGLQGIQEPLKELYPEEGAHGAKGIDSWLSVWSNGFLLENVDENRKKVTRFFPIEALHYCAAVRYVLVPGSAGEGSGERVQQRFLPLDSPFARNPNMNHPPLFAAILRRTSGIKVLECHVFICKRETAANALVRCAFHAYADSTYAKHLENGGAAAAPGPGGQSLYGTIGAPTPIPMSTPTPRSGYGPPMMMAAQGGPMLSPNDPSREYQQSVMEVSEDSINSIEKVEEWSSLANGNAHGNGRSPHRSPQRMIPNGGTPSPRENGNGGSPDDISVLNGADENHKVWPGKTPEPGAAGGGGGGNGAESHYDYGSTLRSFRSSASGLSHRNRPRQMMMPSSPPPPPIPEELQQSGKSSADERDGGGAGKKEKKKKRRSKSRDNVDGGGEGSFVMNGDAVPRMRNGSLSGPPPHFRPVNGHGPPMHPPGPPGMRPGMMPPMPPMPPHMMMPGPPPHPMMMAPPPPGSKKHGTFSGRNSKKRGMPPPFMMFPPGPPPPPHMMPPPHLMPPPGHPLYQQMRYMNGSVEEPIYMPHTARPLSPVASYQPGHFPHEAYYGQQQYATIDKGNKFRKNKPPPSSSHSKSKGSSKNPSSDSNADDSEFGAGIYKKGHINERAFSYSIRNEQRSRSYGSLANANSGAEGEGDSHGENGGGPGGSRGSPGHGHPGDFVQQMSDMELIDDQIERSEVPHGMYNPNGDVGRGAPNGHGPYGNGGPPELMMMPMPMAMPHPQHVNVNGKKKR